MGLELAGLIILLAFSAFFSGSEISVFSLNDLRVKRLTKEKSRRGRVLSNLLKEPRRLLVAVLTGNLFVDLLASAVAERLSSRWLGAWGLEFSVVVMTILLLVFGDIIPKIVAIQRAESWALVAAYPIRLLVLWLGPFYRLFEKMNDWIVQHLSHHEKDRISSEELDTVIDMGEETGVLDTRESSMIAGIVGLSSRTVKEFMQPRDKMFACEMTESLETIYEKIRSRKYSRVPMYRGHLDNIVGILYGKDLMMKEEIMQTRAIQVYDLLRVPFFIPESMKGDQLFREFRKRRIHMAVVVDEFGVVSGLVTLEDLMEEIVGKVLDKGDQTPLYEWISPNKIRVNSRIRIEDFNEILGSTFSDTSAVTLGGFLIHQMGRIPKAGEHYVFGNYEFEVLKAQRHSLEELLVTRIVMEEPR